MMMLQYSVPLDPSSTLFQSFVGATGKGRAVRARGNSQCPTGSCILKLLEKGHRTAPSSTADGWCTGADHLGAAAGAGTEEGDVIAPSRECHTPAHSIAACSDRRDCESSESISWETMFHPGGAPPPPGARPQPLQQHKAPADLSGGSVHTVRLLNTRLRHASAATTPPGVATTASMSQGNTHDNGSKLFSGPYNRSSHVPHDAHSRKRRQVDTSNGGGDAESEGAVSGGNAGDQPVRACTQVRQTYKHARGGSRTRSDSLGDGRDARGRDAGERQAALCGPAGVAEHASSSANLFASWGGPGIACQPHSSPPPPPDNSSVLAHRTSSDSSGGKQVLHPVTSAMSSQSGGAERAGGRSWRGPSPGRGTPPPPPPHALKGVMRACYSDQIIDNSRGLPCSKRLKAAFISVAEVAGHPDLIVPRYLHLIKKRPPLPFQPSRQHHSVSVSPGAAVGRTEQRRGSSAQQGEQTGILSTDSQGAITTATSGHSSSNVRPGARASTPPTGGWMSQGIAKERPADSVSTSGEGKQPPWLNSTGADPRGPQIMQDEMSEVSSVDSDDDEMEDGEVAEEASRVQTHQQQQQNGGAKDSRPCSRADVAPSVVDVSAATAPARVPPWVSNTASGIVHAIRSSQQPHAADPTSSPSRSDGQSQAEQQSGSAPQSREGHQQKLADSHPFQYEMASAEGSSAFKRAKQHQSEASRTDASSADFEARSGSTSVQPFSSCDDAKSGQLLLGSLAVAGTLQERPFPGSSSMVSGSGATTALQNAVPSSSCSARPSDVLQEGAVSPHPVGASSVGVAALSKEGAPVARSESHMMQPLVDGDEALAAAGGSSCLRQASGSWTKACVSTGSSGTGAPAPKPRPVDPRLTRQPKVQTGQQGRLASSGTQPEHRGPTVTATSADAGEVNAPCIGKGELSSVEGKGQPDPAAPAMQPATATPLSFCGNSSSKSGGTTIDSFALGPVVTKPQAEPPRYHVCSVDGTRIELKPPQAPAPGTLPDSLAGTCIARGKLPLLLDLDNTLLHAQATAVTGCDVRLQDWLDENGEPELFRFELSCNRKSYYMKLRPHLRTFLRVLEPYYEMSVYTNATQEYADIVVAILDENRQLFSDRIVARNSGFRGEASESKAVRRMYENMDKRCIVAFDDRQNIWTDLPLSHVVKAQHYDFFDSHRAELNAYYPPLPSMGSNGCGLPSIDALGRMSDEIGFGGELGLPDENQQQQGKGDQQLIKSATSGKKPCDWDKHLDSMLKLFLHVHTEFFRDPLNANIGSILSTAQQGVLSGVGIFFTGYRKTYSPGTAVADCEERQAELAQRLGAKVYKRFDEEGVTHVVAGKNNTNNMLACRENTKLSRVHTLWLYCCEAALTRVPESAFEADALCAYYENSPPTSPYRDHWIHLAQKDDTTKEEKGGSTSKTEIATGSVDGAPWSSLAHQHQPLPPQDNLPVREFLGTGPYSDGATLTSPYEEIVFIWRPDKQTVRQLYGEDIRGAPASSAAGSSPFGSLSSNTGVLLAPVKRGLAGGTSNILGSTAPTDVRAASSFGERPVETSVFTPGLHAGKDEGVLENRRVNTLGSNTCPPLQLDLPY